MDAIRQALAAQCGLLRVKCSVLSTEKDSLFDENQAWRAKHSVLSTENEELRLACRIYKREVERLRAKCGQNEGLTRDVSDLKADLVMADQVNQGLHAKVQELLGSYAELQSEYMRDREDPCPEHEPGSAPPFADLDPDPPLNRFGVRGT